MNLLLVLHILKYYVKRAFRYSSTISQREANEAPIENVQFPNIMLCTDSIHSKYKLRKMYPQVNDTLIQQFYGLDVDPTALVICSFFFEVSTVEFQNLWEIKAKLPVVYKLARSRLERHYNHVNDIDLKELYQKTRSHYYVTQCQLQKIDWYVVMGGLMLVTASTNVPICHQP